MKPSRRRFLQATGAAVAAGPMLAADTVQAASGNDLRLWYGQPAPHWNEALPIGNGRLGAMIFGGIETEQLQFNEDTLCSEEPGTSDLPLDVTKQLDHVVSLLRERDYAGAGDVMTKNWTGRSWPCYQPFGDLHLHFEGHQRFDF